MYGVGGTHILVVTHALGLYKFIKLCPQAWFDKSDITLVPCYNLYIYFYIQLYGIPYR